MEKFILIFQLLWLVNSSTHTGYALASGNANQKAEEKYVSTTLWKELGEGFSYDLRFLTYGTYQDLSDSTQNPENDFLGIPRYKWNLDFRPDFRLNFRRLALSVKPRMNLNYSVWEDGTRSGDEEWEDDWSINEWLARLSLSDRVFLSYGRENLQWGPSYLFSPSNPFFLDNGRSNPRMEVPGMDFARLVWLPTVEWTFSLIINTDKGRQVFRNREFEKNYALKIDYTGQEGYAGLILSRSETERNRIGAFAGWTATDALLLYGDVGFSQGSDILYPVEDGSFPFSTSMKAVDGESSSWKGAILLGGAYTFLAGPTLTVEYLYNGQGYDGHQTDLYQRLKNDASIAYDSPLQGLSMMTLGRTVDPGLRFLRRHYAMVQYRHSDIRDIVSMTLRWTYNLEDESGRFSALVDCFVGDHIQLFSVGGINHCSRNTEFRAMLDCYLMLGLEYTF